MYVYVQCVHVCIRTACTCMYMYSVYMYVYVQCVHVCICTVCTCMYMYGVYMYVYVQRACTCIYVQRVHVCICTVCTCIIFIVYLSLCIMYLSRLEKATHHSLCYLSKLRLTVTCTLHIYILHTQVFLY